MKKQISKGCRNSSEKKALAELVAQYAPAKRKSGTSSHSALVVVIRDHGHALSVIL